MAVPPAAAAVPLAVAAVPLAGAAFPAVAAAAASPCCATCALYSASHAPSCFAAGFVCVVVVCAAVLSPAALADAPPDDTSAVPGTSAAAPLAFAHCGPAHRVSHAIAVRVVVRVTRICLSFSLECLGAGETSTLRCAYSL